MTSPIEVLDRLAPWSGVCHDLLRLLVTLVFTQAVVVLPRRHSEQVVPVRMLLELREISLFNF